MMIKKIDKKEFARKLFVFRKKQKLTKVEVSRRIGISRNTYADWEDPDNETIPGSLNTYYALSQVLGFGMHFMAYGTLEHERDARYTERIDRFYQRKRSEPAFNTLTHQILEMSPEEVKHLTSFLQAQKQASVTEASVTEASVTEASVTEASVKRPKISRT